MNTSKLTWATSARDYSPDASTGGASWAPMPACISSGPQFALQNFYRVAYERAQAQVAQKQELFRDLVAEVDFERVAEEQSRLRALIEGIDFGSEL